MFKQLFDKYDTFTLNQRAGFYLRNNAFTQFAAKRGYATEADIKMFLKLNGTLKKDSSNKTAEAELLKNFGITPSLFRVNAAKIQLIVTGRSFEVIKKKVGSVQPSQTESIMREYDSAFKKKMDAAREYKNAEEVRAAYLAADPALSKNYLASAQGHIQDTERMVAAMVNERASMMAANSKFLQEQIGFNNIVRLMLMKKDEGKERDESKSRIEKRIEELDKQSMASERAKKEFEKEKAKELFVLKQAYLLFFDELYA